MAADAKRVTRPHPQQTVKCPRCNSSETKFCYYNNYSTTQPRYFCKNCKRYWTDGGTHRNVPVGGGLRKNKRSKPKVNPAPSPPPPSASMHQPKASSLTLTDNACGVNHSAIAGHVGFPNSNLDINFGLPHSPNYLLFNPRNYEMDIKSAPIMPLYQPDNNNNQHIAPPFPLPLLAAGFKNDPTFSGACFSAIPWQKEKSTPESLQPGGFMSMTDTSSETYTFNNFINVNDWQQVSEGFLGAGGDDNYALIPPPQRPQWSDFDAGTRL